MLCITQLAGTLTFNEPYAFLRFRAKSYHQERENAVVPKGLLLNGIRVDQSPLCIIVLIFLLIKVFVENSFESHRAVVTLC